MANILFVNLRKSKDKINQAVAEAEHFGHRVFHLLDGPKERLINTIYSDRTKEDFINNIQLAIDMFDIKYITTQTDIIIPVLDCIETDAFIIPELKTKMQTLTDKILFSHVCEKINIPFFKYKVSKTLEDLSEIPQPFFIKPSIGTAGSVAGTNQGNKFRWYDYTRFENYDDFISCVDLQDFFEIQNNGAEFSGDKGIAGIKGKYIIQECVVANHFFIFCVTVHNGNIDFVYVSKIQTPTAEKTYYQDNNSRETLFLNETHNKKDIINFCGNHVYETFNDQIIKVLQNTGFKNGIFCVDFIPYKKSYALQDINLRIGGTISKMLLSNKLFSSSIWKHIT